MKSVRIPNVFKASATELPSPDNYFDAVFTDLPYYDNVLTLTSQTSSTSGLKEPSAIYIQNFSQPL